MSTEKMEEVNGEFGEYGEIFFPSSEEEKESPSKGSFVGEVTCSTRWRQTPRNPSFFSNCKTPVSSCKDSDYEAWLTNYYEELYQKENSKMYYDKKTDTCDLHKKEVKATKSLALSIFPNITADSTKYWGIKEPRRHWPLSKTSKEYLLFPTIHPLLNVSSRYGRYLTCLHSASGVVEIQRRKKLCAIFALNLLRAKVFSHQFAKLICCDNLISISWFDFLSKRSILRTLCLLLRNQRHLEVVCFENAQFQQLEGIVLLCALSRDGGDTIKELHMWKMFAFGHCPVLKDKISMAARSKSNTSGKLDLTHHFMDILNNFLSLTHLSINYAYLANENGDALLRLRTIICGCLQELRLLCLPEERPLLTNPDSGVGGFQITDGVWRRVRELSPQLRVMFVFLNMPQYENIILFLSKNIPLASFYVSSGIDFRFENPWEIDTTLLELRNWYSSILDTLCLHLWHHRDLLDYVIEYKILDEFPNLVNFEFIGVLKCPSTLEGFCKRLLTKNYKLKNLLFWVEESRANKRDEEIRKRVMEIKKNYLQKLQNLEIDAFIRTYPA